MYLIKIPFMLFLFYITQSIIQFFENVGIGGQVSFLDSRGRLPSTAEARLTNLGGSEQSSDVPSPGSGLSRVVAGYAVG